MKGIFLPHLKKKKNISSSAVKPESAGQDVDMASFDLSQDFPEFSTQDFSPGMPLVQSSTSSSASCTPTSSNLTSFTLI